MSRRPSRNWALPPDATPAPELEVLIPTFERPAELAVTLAGLAAQDDPPFSVVVSDQSAAAVSGSPSVSAMVRVLEAQGRRVRMLRHVPPRGMAEQREFLLGQSGARLVLFLDDDVWLEPGMLRRLTDAIDTLGCGFVGAAVQGLSYLGDKRPHERESFEVWQTPVAPERMRHDTPGFGRWRLHNAANLLHQQATLGIPDDGWLAYKIAWLGACVLYDRAKLVDCGGFAFWPQLPAAHSGEDVVAEWRVLQRYGGAGILPTGAVHLESPTTIEDRTVDAPDVFFGEGARSATPAAADTARPAHPFHTAG
jgi:GT2 family glycosyltransferase